MKTLSEQYEICKERGEHLASDFMLMSNPPWQVCRMCGTHYRFDLVLVESNVPY